MAENCNFPACSARCQHCSSRGWFRSQSDEQRIGLISKYVRLRLWGPYRRRDKPDRKCQLLQNSQLSQINQLISDYAPLQHYWSHLRLNFIPGLIWGLLKTLSFTPPTITQWTLNTATFAIQRSCAVSTGTAHASGRHFYTIPIFIIPIWCSWSTIHFAHYFLPELQLYWYMGRKSGTQKMYLCFWKLLT